MTVLPVPLQENARVDAMTGGLLPWGAPFLFGTVGVTPPPMESEIRLAFEWPLPTLPRTEQTSKVQLESWHPSA